MLMMVSRLLKSKVLIVVSLVICLFATWTYGQQANKAWPDAYPKKGENGVPESVDKLTIVVDSWGTSELNPWTLFSVSFLGDYFNLRLMMQDPNGDLAPAWATEVKQTDDGLTFTLNPKAKFQDGTPADAEAVKQNLEGFMGNFVGQAGYETPTWNSANAKEFIDSIQVLSPTELFVKTKGPSRRLCGNWAVMAIISIGTAIPRNSSKAPRTICSIRLGAAPIKSRPGILATALS